MNEITEHIIVNHTRIDTPISIGSPKSSSELMMRTVDAGD